MFTNLIKIFQTCNSKFTLSVLARIHKSIFSNQHEALCKGNWFFFFFSFQNTRWHSLRTNPSDLTFAAANQPEKVHVK